MFQTRHSLPTSRNTSQVIIKTLGQGRPLARENLTKQTDTKLLRAIRLNMHALVTLHMTRCLKSRHTSRLTQKRRSLAMRTDTIKTVSNLQPQISTREAWNLAIRALITSQRTRTLKSRMSTRAKRRRRQETGLRLSTAETTLESRHSPTTVRETITSLPPKLHGRIRTSSP